MGPAQRGSRSPKQYPGEFRERAVRLGAEHRGEYESEYAAIRSVAVKLGISAAETLGSGSARPGPAPGSGRV